MAEPTISELLGVSDSQNIIITDNRLERGKRNSLIGNLRSLPLLYRLGLTDYTFNNHWIHRMNITKRQRSVTASYMWKDVGEGSKEYDFDLIPKFRYHVLDEEEKFNSLEEELDTLVMAANQQTEDTQRTTSVRDFIDSDIRRKILLVPEEFHFKGESHGRQVGDYEDFVTVRYEDLLNRYMDTKSFQLSSFNSKNIVIRELEDEFFRSQGYASEDIKTLFDVTQIPESFSTREHIRNLSKPYTVERNKLIRTLFYPWTDCDSGEFSPFTKTLLKSVYIFKLQRWQ